MIPARLAATPGRHAWPPRLAATPGRHAWPPGRHAWPLLLAATPGTYHVRRARIAPMTRMNPATYCTLRLIANGHLITLGGRLLFELWRALCARSVIRLRRNHMHIQHIRRQ